MATGQDVSAQRQRLRAELRSERKLAQATQKEVARAMDWSPSKMLRIEAGAVGISATDLRALLNYYNIEDKQQIEDLLDLTRAARTRRRSRVDHDRHPRSPRSLRAHDRSGDRGAMSLS